VSDNVVRFPKSNLSDVPGMLRKLADDIEAGTWGEVPICLVVLPRQGEWPDVFGFGPEGDTSDAALIGHLELAKAFFISHVAERE
jgi:hypothetical protein